MFNKYKSLISFILTLAIVLESFTMVFADGDLSLNSSGGPSTATPTDLASNTDLSTKPPKKSGLLGMPLRSPAPAEPTISINDKPANGNAQVTYGDELTITINPASIRDDISVEYSYLEYGADYEEATWNLFTNKYSATRPPRPGKYAIGYVNYYKNGDTNTSHNDKSGNQFFNVVAAKLSSTQSVSWEGTTAKWDAVTRVTNNDAWIVENGAVEYEVKLMSGSSIIATLTTAATSINLYQQIFDAGYNHYTFTVTAKPSASWADCYVASDSVTSGELEFTDTDAPAEFSIGVAGNAPQRYITSTAVYDAGSGIKRYAFSTISDATATTPLDWKEINLGRGESFALEFHPVSGGAYYAYVCDAFGNVRRSSNSVEISAVHLHDYFYENQKDDDVRDKANYYLYNGDSVTLPVTDASVMVHKGYEFTNEWYTSADFNSDTKVVSFTAIAEPQDVNYYAKWNKIEFKFNAQLENYEFIYGDQYATLSATVSGDDGLEVEWHWYRANSVATSTDIPDGAEEVSNSSTTGTYASIVLKNVSESGFYYAKAIRKDVNYSEYNEITTSTASVTIKKKSVGITIGSIEIVYGDDAPSDYSYTYAALDFAFGDTPETSLINTSAGFTVSANGIRYEKFISSIGNYVVTPNFESPNYYFVGSGDLSVIPAETFVVTLDPDSYVYTGDDIVANVIVKDSRDGRAIASDNYSIAYESNINVTDSAIVKVTFTNNYSGSAIKNFAITKTTFDAIVSITGIDNWTYGDADADHIVSVSGIPSVGNPAEPVYWYLSVTSGVETNDKPLDAGFYSVYAVIPASENYDEVHTASIGFEIKKKEIVISVPGICKVYDGTELKPNDPIVIGDFGYSDNFQRINVVGSQTEVGSTTPSIEYILTSSTNPDNYNITTEAGLVEVTKQKLQIPSSYSWSNDAPGTAVWFSAGSAADTQRHELVLYKEDGSIITTTIAAAGIKSINFADAIKSNNNSAATSYYFTIKALNPEGNDNYENSDVSVSSASINTVRIHLAQVSGVVGTISAIITDAAISNPSDYMVLIAGERVNAQAVCQVGHSFDNPIWTSSTEGALDIASPTRQQTVISVPTSITQSYDGVSIIIHSDDDDPIIETYEAQGNPEENYQSVKLHFVVSDTNSVSAWAITTKTNANNINNWTTCNATSVDSFVTVAGVNETYYLFVEDSNGNVVSSKGIKIYSVNFARNNTTDEKEISAMAVMLKGDNCTIKLRDIGFAKDDHVFTYWQATDGSKYSDCADYSANASAVLKPNWTKAQIEYYVEYFYMDENGNWPTLGEKTKYIGEAGTTVSKAGLESNGKKYGLDNVYSTSGSLIENITLRTRSAGDTLGTESNPYKIYFQRNKLNIAYVYENLNDNSGSELVFTSASFYYGQTVTEMTSNPAVAGYTFIGWDYGAAGSKPTTMPNKNLTARAIYATEPTKYKINYYFQDVNSDSFIATNTDLNREITALHGQTIEFSLDNPEYAREYNGFTLVSVSAVNGSGDIYTNISSDSVQGRVSKEEGKTLNVNYFYKRNTYTLTLNIYRTSGDELITRKSIELKYGATISSSGVYASEINNIVGDEAVSAAAFNAILSSPEPGKLDKHELIADTIWSTSDGNAPEAMPAGNLTVVRRFIPLEPAEFKLSIHLQNANGNYSTFGSFAYQAWIGDTASVDDTDSDSNAQIHINYKSLSDRIDDFKYYVYNATDAAVTTAAVKADNSTELHIYFDRITTSVTIRYQFENLETNTTGNKAEWTTSYVGIWGSKFEIKDYLTKYFDTSAPGTDASFRNDEYLISYRYSYRTGRDRSTGETTLKSEESLTSSKMATVGKIASENYIEIYYKKIKDSKTTDTSYSVKVVLDSSNGTGDNKLHNVEAFIVSSSIYNSNNIRLSDGTTTYDALYLVNKSTIYRATTTDIRIETYPGLSRLNINSPDLKQYNYESAPKSNFRKININGKNETSYEYYVSGNALYYFDQENPEQFYEGQYTGTSKLQNSNRPEMEFVNTFIEAYKDAGNEIGDSESTSVVFRESGFWGSKAGNYTFYFKYLPKCQITYVLEGVSCTNNALYLEDGTGGHKHLGGSIVVPECNHANKFTNRSGYDIVWYLDAGYTKPASPSFVITGDAILYGRYEKSILTNKISVYYINPDTGEYVSGTALSAATATVTTEATIVTKEAIVPAEYRYVERVVTTTSYTIDDVEVARIIEKPVLAYESTNNSDYTINKNDYITTGFIFDDGNPENKVAGSWQGSPVEFKLFVEREKYTLTVSPGTDPSGNTELGKSEYLYRYGKKVTLIRPEKAGYSFGGWQYSPSGIEVILNPSTDASGNTTFRMPAQNLEANAPWTASDTTATAIHYFADDHGVYETEIIEKLIAATGTDLAPEKVISAEAVGSPKKYEINGATYVSVEKTSGSATYTYYYKVSVNGDNYVADHVGLLGVVERERALTETTTKAIDHKFNYAEFNFDYAVYVSPYINLRLDADSVYTNSAIATTYYYYQTKPFSIDAKAFATDGGQTEVTIVGTGSYKYKQEFELEAFLKAGYEFEGWFKPDQLDTDGKYKSGVTSANAISQNLTIGGIVTDNVTYVAVVRPLDPDRLIVLVTSATIEYTYGYKVGKDSSINCTVTASAATLNSSTYVSRYEWIKVDGETESVIDGAYSASYDFPAGMVVGNYTYKCRVTISNKDNGRTITSTSDAITITVVPATMIVKTEDYTIEYNGANHGIEVSYKGVLKSTGYETVNSTVYYAFEPLDEGNYNAVGTSVAGFGVKDVRLDAEGNVTSTGIYYYIEGTQNYKAASGVAFVTVVPLKVTVKASNSSILKQYDGTTNLSETLVRGICQNAPVDSSNSGYYYSITGLIDADKSWGNYITGDAIYFNSKDCKDASTVTLKNIKFGRLSNGAFETNPNYYIEANQDLVLNASITKIETEFVWSKATDTDLIIPGDLDFIYNGQAQAPIAVISKAGFAQEVQDIINSEISGVAISGAKTNYGENYKAVASVVASGSGFDASNYSIVSNEAFFNIAKFQLYVSPVAATVDYDGQAHTLDMGNFVLTGNSLGLSGLPSGHVPTASAVGSYVSAGSYVLGVGNFAVMANGQNVADNYELSSDSAVLVIRPRISPITITAIDKQYDGTNVAELVIELGVLDGADVTVSGIVATFTDLNVVYDGDRNVTSQIVNIDSSNATLAGNNAGDYTFVYPTTCEATIFPREVFVSMSAVKDYDGNATAEGATIISTVENVVTDEAITMTGIEGSYNSKDAADAIEIVITNFGSATVATNTNLNNYNITVPTTASGIINRKILNATVTSESIVYNGTTNASLCAIVETGVAGEAFDVINTEAYFADKNVTSSATVYVNTNAGVLSPAGASANPGNYILVLPETAGAYNITKRPVLVYAVSTEKAFGLTDPAFEFAAVQVGTDPDSGMVEGETLEGVTVKCEAPNTGAAVGVYTISAIHATGTDLNYEVTVTNTGMLTIKAAVLTVSAIAKSSTYGEKAPVFTVTYTGFMNGHTAGSFGLTETSAAFKILKGSTEVAGIATNSDLWTGSEAKKTTAGSYIISPSGLADISNYQFVYKTATYTVNKKNVTISGIEAENKYYNGLTNATVAAANAPSILGDANDDFVNGLVSVNTKDAFTLTFDNATAGATHTVSITYKTNILTGPAACNYNVVTGSSQQTISPVVISKASLTIKAKDTTIVFGEDVTNSGVTYAGLQHNDRGEDLNLQFTYDYSYHRGNSQNVGDYVITVSTVTVPDNYELTTLPGILHITQSAFNLIANWDYDHPGTASWAALNSEIEHSSVSNYTITLYRGIEEVRTISVGTSTYFNFASDIKASGAGAYSYRVVATASHPDNIATSVQTSAALYAANVILESNNATVSAVTIGGISGTTNASIVMIAGETTSAIVAMKYGYYTGYTIKSTAAKTAIKISNETQSSISRYDYAAELKLATTTAVTAIKVTAALTARPATLATPSVIAYPWEVTGNYASATYGYREDSAPTFAAIATSTDLDTVGADGYEYTYKWAYRVDQNTARIESSPTSSAVWSFPIYKNGTSEDMPGGTGYQAKVIVTAKRRDNGQEITKEARYVDVHILPDKITAAISPAAWIYDNQHTDGAFDTLYMITTRSAAKIDADRIAKTKYYYVKGSDVDSTIVDGTVDLTDSRIISGIPKDVGTYYVFADIAKSNNFGATRTSAVAVTISPKPITATVTAVDKIYDGNANITVSVVVNTGVGNEKIEITNITAAVIGNDKNVTTNGILNVYTASAVYTTSNGAKLTNYIISFDSDSTDITATISQRAVTLTWSATQLKFKNEDLTITAAATNKCDGDVIDFIYDGATKSAVGNYVATVTGITGTDAQNYTLSAIAGATGVSNAWSIVYEVASAASISGTAITGAPGASTMIWYVSTPTDLIAPTGYQISVGDRNNWRDKYSYDVESTYALTYYLKNISDDSQTDEFTTTFGIDLNDPQDAVVTVGGFAWTTDGDLTKKFFYKGGTANVNSYATDTALGSGITKTEYKVSGGAWSSSVPTLSANTTTAVWVRFTDNAGRTTVITSGCIVVYTDAQASTTSITYHRAIAADRVDGKVDVKLNGNTIKYVSGNGITSADYSTSGSIITLSATYLNKLDAGQSYEFEVYYNPLGYEFATGTDLGEDANITTFSAVIKKTEGKITNIENLNKIFDNTAVSNPAIFTYKGNGATSILFNTSGAGLTGAYNQAPTSAGLYDLIIQAAETQDYTSVVAITHFAISKRPITITMASLTKTYGDENDALTVSAIGGMGLATGHTFDDLIFTSYCAVATYTDIGTYDITGAAVNPNYDATIVKGTYTINRRLVTASSIDAIDREYDGTKEVVLTGTAVGNKATLNNVVNSDDVYGYVYIDVPATGAAASKDVGDGLNVTIATPALKGSKANNYTLGAITGVDVNISRRAITATVTAVNKIYDANVNITVSAVVNTGVSGEIITISGITAKIASNDANVTTNGIIAVNTASAVYETAAGTSLTNYLISYDSDTTVKTATISQRALTITMGGLSKYYGDPVANITCEAFGFADDEGLTTIGFTSYTAVTSKTAVGNTYAITCASVADQSKNYSIVSVPAVYVVSPRALTVTMTALSKYYGDPVANITCEAFGFAPGEGFATIGFTSFSAVTSMSAVSRYAITCESIAADSTNYSIVSVPAIYTVSPRALTITIASVSKAYGDVNPVITAEAFGWAADHNLATIGFTTYTAVATYTDIGHYDITGTALEPISANYSITSNVAVFEVTKKAIRVDVLATSRAYGNDNPANFAYTSTGIVNNDNIGLQLTTAALKASDVGFYNVEFESVVSSNYAITVSGSGIYEITKRAITLVVEDKIMTYGAAVPELTVTISSVSGEGLAPHDAIDVLGITSYSAVTSGSIVSKYAITAAAVGPKVDNYDIEISDGTLEVTKRAITLIVEDKEKVYSLDDIPPLTVTVSAVSGYGIAPHDTIDVLGITSYTAVTSATAVGTYPITAAATGTKIGNYDITISDGSFRVVEKSIVITMTALSMYYGDEVPTITCEAVGFADNDTLADIGFTCSVAATSLSAVGEYEITGAATNAKYAITVIPAYLTISPRAVTVTIASVSKTYGEDNPVITAEAVGLVTGHSLATLDFATHTAVEKYTSAGSYSITGSATNGNYDITSNVAVFTVDQRALTITMGALSKYYGDDVVSLTCEAFGFATGEDLTTIGFTSSTAVTSMSAVGTYTNVISGAYVASKATNYSITIVPATFTVSQRALTITIASVSKTYGDVNPVITSEAVGLVTGHSLATLGFATNTAVTQFTSIGKYSITGSATNTDLVKNYDITSNVAVFEVTKKAIRVDVYATSRAYGDDNPANFAYTSTGIVNNDDIDLVLTTAAVKTSAVDFYDVVFESVVSSNYAITVSGSGIFEITKRAITLVVEDKTMTYGAAVPDLTVTISAVSGAGLAPHERDNFGVLNYTSYTGVTSTSEVGIYAITGAATNANYAITISDGALSVVKRNVIITMAALSKVYGDDVPNLTCETFGFADGENLATIGFTSYTAVTSLSEVGDNYDITGAATSTNYDISIADAKLTVTARPLTITIASVSKTYGDANPVITAEAVGLVTGQSLATLGFTTHTAVATYTDIGDYDITGSAVDPISANYSITSNVAVFSITAKAILVEVVPTSRAYGLANPASFEVTSAAGSILNGDDLALVLTTDAIENSNIGKYNVSLVSANSNYDVTVSGASVLEVTKRAVTVTVNTVEKIYGNDIPSFSATITDGDTLSHGTDELGLVFSTAITSVTGIGSYDVTGVASNPNYDVTVSGTGVLAVVERPVSVEWIGTTKTENGQVQTVGAIVSNLVNNDSVTLTLINDSASAAGTYIAQVIDIAGNPNYTITNGSGLTKTWVINTKPAPAPDPTPVAPKPTTESAITKPAFVTPAGFERVVDPHTTGVERYFDIEKYGYNIPYIYGDEQNMVRPEDNFTRAEAAELFYRLLKDKGTMGRSFPDVPEGVWYEKSVRSLANLGIINGCDDGNYWPEREIDRAEFVTLAVKFAYTVKGYKNFVDVTDSHWAKAFIDTATEYGWIDGYDDNTFKPQNTITRAEAVLIIERMLYRIPDVEYINNHLEEMMIFDDLRDPKKWYFYFMVDASVNYKVY